MANITCCAWINISGEAETQLHKVTEQATWLTKVISSTGSFFDLILVGLGLGDHGSEVHSRHWELSCS